MDSPLVLGGAAPDLHFHPREPRISGCGGVLDERLFVVLEPPTVRLVCRNRLPIAAQEVVQRCTQSPTERVPEGDVDGGDRELRHSLAPDERRSRPHPLVCDPWRRRFALDEWTEHRLDEAASRLAALADRVGEAESAIAVVRLGLNDDKFERAERLGGVVERLLVRYLVLASANVGHRWHDGRSFPANHFSVPLFRPVTPDHDRSPRSGRAARTAP